MKIPLAKDRKERRERELRKLQAEADSTAKDLKHLAYRAQLLATQARNGDQLSRDRFWSIVDEMERRGMAPGTIPRGPSAFAKLAELIDRPAAIVALLGHLLEAVDLLEAAGETAEAAQLRTIFDRHDNPANAAEILRWREITRPRVEIYRHL